MPENPFIRQLELIAAFKKAGQARQELQRALSDATGRDIRPDERILDVLAEIEAKNRR